MNLILSDCVEHVYPVVAGDSAAAGQSDDLMQEEPLGVYFVRGDNIAMIAQIEPQL